MSRTAVIDADSLVYMAALGVEYEWEVDADLWLLWSELQPAIARLDDLIATIQEKTEADELVMVLTDYDHPNWRLSVLPTYKSNRKASRRPIVWRPLREYLEEEWKTYCRPTLEGDDVCGILATHPHLIPGEKVIVSIDKDMMTIPGLHCSLKHIRDTEFSDPHVFEVTEEEADRFHMLQTLAGDPTDGYSGCPGLGMVRAEKLLEEGRVVEQYEHTLTRGPRKGETETRTRPGEPGTDWEIIVSAYEAAGLCEEEALRQARVARICRAHDYNFDSKEVILWTP